MKKIPDKAFTHGGKFHADDVFSSALLKILNPKIKISRTLKIIEQPDCLYYDIGFGEFDHHQKNAPIRENGIPYAAFGLLWKEFGNALLAEKAWKEFDETFVSPLDLEDNTGKYYLLSELIAAFNPVFDSEADVDSRFELAVGFAKGVLEREFEKIHAFERAEKLVRDALKNAKDGIAVLKIYCPWKKTVEETDILFMVYPSNRGGFAAQAVQKSREDISSKCPFPLEWAGKTSAELREISGIKTLNFCHNNRFLITAETLEDCVNACYQAISGQKNK